MSPMMIVPSLIKRSRQAGFTLVELVVGLVISTISIAMFATLIVPLFTRSVEPLLQIRAAELAQSILEQATAYRYDENTPVGGSPPCNGLGGLSCTPSASFGTDAGEANRASFDDLDDFNAFCAADNNIQDVFGNDLTTGGSFANFSFRLCVAYDGNFNGAINEAASGEANAKLLTVTVTPPQPASALTVSVYRSNY
ncbi:MAG: type II secretion system GspH family protein [Pseudomonadales bacterium]|nr:type II secretion system GspH family protein [Pseudomonadales bacterium]